MNPSVTIMSIIRHGETDWNSSGRLQGCEDTELNNLGREQAGKLADFLKEETWDLIISSPLQRALETARIISSKINIPGVQTMEGLRERDYGKASGLLPEERRSLYPDGIFPDQEEFEHLRTRAFDTITSIAKKYEGKRIIVVSHGAFINSVLYTISNGEFGSFKTRLKNGCVNRLVYSQSQWSVTYYNKTP
jgi:uncharacterized phosphatase